MCENVINLTKQTNKENVATKYRNGEFKCVKNIVVVMVEGD